jgi:hypothetical protein
VTRTPIASHQSNPHAITVVFDTGNLEEAKFLRAFRKSFGEGYSLLEYLEPRRYCSLDLLPGGALEGRR